MKVVVVKPGQSPEVVEIANTLQALQGAVGGYIETVSLPNGLILICNEEGKLLNLPANRKLGYDYIAGDFLVTAGNDEGDFVSLSDAQIAAAKGQFKL